MDPLFRQNIVRPTPKKNTAIYTAFNFKTEKEMRIKNRYILHKLILIMCLRLLAGIYIAEYVFITNSWKLRGPSFSLSFDIPRN